MTSNDEILKSIQKMGYNTISYTRMRPSYYKLKDGTIISALVLPLQILETNKENIGGSGYVNIVNAYVPPRLREPKKFNPKQQNSQISKSDLDFDILIEDYSIYTLSNGSKMSIRTVVGQIDKMNTVSPVGEHIYRVQTQPVIKIK